jgi:hypothetical protein
MFILDKRAGLIAAVAALTGAAACGNSSRPMDDGMKQDLAAAVGSKFELAPSGRGSQVVVSAIEGGPKATPAPAVQKPTVRPTSRPATRVAANPTVAPAPAAQPAVQQRTTRAPVREVEPPPLPPSTRQPTQRQSGTYKTEAEVFRQMPWIKP